MEWKNRAYSSRAYHLRQIRPYCESWCHVLCREQWCGQQGPQSPLRYNPSFYLLTDDKNREKWHLPMRRTYGRQSGWKDGKGVAGVAGSKLIKNLWGYVHPNPSKEVRKQYIWGWGWSWRNVAWCGPECAGMRGVGVVVWRELNPRPTGWEVGAVREVT